MTLLVMCVMIVHVLTKGCDQWKSLSYCRCQLLSAAFAVFNVVVPLLCRTFQALCMDMVTDKKKRMKETNQPTFTCKTIVKLFSIKHQSS